MKRLAVRNIIKPARTLVRTYYEGAASEPFHPIPNRKPKYMSADEAVKVVKSGKWPNQNKKLGPLCNVHLNGFDCSFSELGLPGLLHCLLTTIKQ